jgi:hypothetical protein
MFFFTVMVVMPMMTGASILPTHGSSSLQPQVQASIKNLLEPF